MKAVVIVFILALFFSSCLRVDPELTGKAVVIKGRLTFNCNDSTPMKNIGLVLSSNTQEAYSTTDSNGRFVFNMDGSGNPCDLQIVKSGGVIYSRLFPNRDMDLGDIFYNPCFKVVLHYDTVGHTLNLSQPFFVMFNTTREQLTKQNLQSLAKPDSLYWRGTASFGRYDFPDFIYGLYSNSKYGKLNTPLKQSYEWQHVVTKVP